MQFSILISLFATMDDSRVQRPSSAELALSESIRGGNPSTSGRSPRGEGDGRPKQEFNIKD